MGVTSGISHLNGNHSVVGVTSGTIDFVISFLLILCFIDIVLVSIVPFWYLSPYLGILCFIDIVLVSIVPF